MTAFDQEPIGVAEGNYTDEPPEHQSSPFPENPRPLKLSDHLKVFVVESQSGDADLIGRFLARSQTTRFQVARLPGDERSLNRLQGNDDRLLVLCLPEVDALVMVRRATDAKHGIPIVVLAPRDDEALSVRTMQLGVQDFVVRGKFNPALLIRSLRNAADRHRKLNALKSARQYDRYLATHDSLTGLPNRQAFFDRLAVARAHAARYHLQFAVLFLDLDGFKQVNDRFGHVTGDDVLQSAAKRFAGCIRKSDTVARFGGDEFTVILGEVTAHKDIAIVAKKILAALSEHFMIMNHAIVIPASIGIAVYPRDGESVERLVERADQAMYVVKRSSNQARYCFYADVRALIGHEHAVSKGP